MTVSLLTKPRKAATIAPSSALLVLQPPGHIFAASHLLTPGEYRIGSSPECELVLEADGIASEHVLLSVSHAGVRLQALDGHTWVNDFLVTQATVRRGDRLSFGPLTFTLRAATADDLLAQLPAQDAQPAEPLRSAPPTEPAVIAAIDEALAHVEAARNGIEPLSPFVESTAPDATPQSHDSVADTAAMVVDGVVATESTGTDESLVEEAPISVALTAPTLTAEIAAWQAERVADEEQSRKRQTELAALVADLEERELRLAAEIAAWQAERAAAEEQSRTRQTELAALAAGLEERESRFAGWEARLIRREDVLDQRHAEVDAQRTELDHRESALTAERIRLEQIATTARTELAAEAEKQAAAWTDWETTQRRLSAELNGEFTALAEVEAACSATKAQLVTDQKAWAETRAAWQTEQAEWEARRQEQQHQLAEWEIEAEQLRAEISQERTQLAEQRADLQAEACQRSAAHRELIETRQEVQRERRLLAEQQSALIAERETEWLDLRERRRRMDADEREIAELRRQTQESWNEAEVARSAAQAIVVVPAATPEIVEPVVSQPAAEITPSWESTTPGSPGFAVDAPVDEVLPAPLPETPNAAADVDAQINEAPQHNWMESRFEEYPASENSLTANWDTNFDAPPLGSIVEADRIDNPPSPIIDEFSLNRFDNQWPAEASPIAEPWGNDHHADMNATAVEGMSVPAESAFVEPFQPDSGEAESQESLRAQLAEMFGLPQDFGNHAALEDEAADTQAVFTSPESPVLSEPAAYEEPETSVDSPAQDVSDEPASEDADDAWRSQLAAMLAVQEAAPQPEPVITAPEMTASVEKHLSPPPVPTPAQPAPPNEDDSITAYMERLLARNKMSSLTLDESPLSTASKTEVAAAAPRYTVETTVTELASTPDAVEAVPAVSLPLPEPRQRVDKDEVRAALQSFREVANLSARTAIAEHGTKTLRGEVTVQSVLAGLAGVAGGAFLLPPLWGGAIQPWPGVGCLIAAGWMSWQISQSLHRLKTWHPGDRLEIESVDEIVDADAEEITAAASEIVPDAESMIDNSTTALNADHDEIRE